MEDREIIERLEDILETLKKGEREQAECDLADLYEEIQAEYDDYEEDDSEDYDDDSDSDSDEDE